MKKTLPINGHNWTIETTKYGADIFCDGGYIITVGYTLMGDISHAYWMKTAAIWIAENNHKYFANPSDERSWT
jgi:hypothetical protein